MCRGILRACVVLGAALLFLIVVWPRSQADAQQRRVRVNLGPIGVVSIGGAVKTSKRVRRDRSGGAGQDSEEITQIQTALVSLGFNPGAVNGKMGSQTRAAIKELQQSLDQPATGRLTEGEQDELLNAYCKVVTPTRSATVENLLVMIGPSALGGGAALSERSASGLPVISTGMRGFCLSPRATTNQSVLSDQFCVARVHVMQEAAKAFDARAVDQPGLGRETIRRDCASMAAATQSALATLPSQDSVDLATRLTQDNTIRAGALLERAVGNATICLGVAYAEDRADLALASALMLISLGQTGYAELIGAHLALGHGVERNRSRASEWFTLAAQEVAGGVSPVVKSDKSEGACRPRILQIMSRELSN
jgi:peptidoglycan hydrolase-like protein with peptidoglycan-binding domain